MYLPPRLFSLAMVPVTLACPRPGATGVRHRMLAEAPHPRKRGSRTPPDDPGRVVELSSERQNIGRVGDHHGVERRRVEPRGEEIRTQVEHDVVVAEPPVAAKVGLLADVL